MKLGQEAKQILFKMRAAARRQPFCLLAAVFILGLFLAQALWLPACLCIIIGGACLLLLEYAYKKSSLALAMFCLLILGVIWMASGITEPKAFIAGDGQEVKLCGTALENSQAANEDTGAFRFKIEKMNDLYYRGPDVIVYYRDNKIYYGDKLIVFGTVWRGDKYGNPGSFDYLRSLQVSGIGGTVSTCYGDDALIKVGIGGNPLLYAVGKIRAKLNTAIDDLPDLQSAVLKGVFLGEKGELSKNQREILANAGVLSVFAVSGLHITIVLMAALLLTGVSYRYRFWRLLVGMFFVVFYLLLVGNSPSVLRAALMAAFVLLAPCFNEKANFYSSIAFAAFVLLVYQPLQLFQAGFLLSFGAAFGLVYLNNFFLRLLPLRLPFKHLWSVSLAAGLTVMPLVAYYFYKLSFVGFLLMPFINILAGGVVVLAMFSALLLTLSLPLYSFCIAADGLLCELLYRISAWGAQLPFLHTTVAKPPLAVVFILICFLILLPYIAEFWSRRAKVFAVLLIPVCLLLPYGSNCGKLEVSFLDVGQGLCVYISTPGGADILYDGGGSFSGSDSIAEYVILPYLQCRGVRELDLIISSHPHIDHIGGLTALMPYIPVKKAVTSRSFCGNDLQQQFLHQAEAFNAQIIFAEAGEIIFKENNLTINVVCAPSLQHIKDEGLNENSLAVLISYGKQDFLLTGDLGSEQLADLTSLEAEVIQISHHGSADGFNKRFYNSQPLLAAVVPVGRKNTFGHPAKIVTDYFTDRDIALFRTDLDGALSFICNGKEIKVQSFSGRKEEFL